MKRTLHLLLLTLVFTMAGTANAQQPKRPGALAQKTVPPIQRAVTRFSTLDFRQAAAVEKANPPQNGSEIDEIELPQPPPNMRKGVPITGSSASRAHALAAPLSSTGPSPGPSKTFKAEFLSGTSIPPDTMGAVGSTHIVAVTNDRMRIFNRDGVELSRMTLTAFWAGVTIKGAAIAAFDPKVFFDRFNNRFILVSSGNGQGVNSGAMFAVSQTADPTGLWNRYSVAADPASTAAGGHWIDYPSVGHNKNWIVIDENVFNFGTAGSGFFGTQIYVLDKQAAYSNTLASINLFQGDFNATCLSSATPETEVACGFTMAPAITEDNTTDTEYMVEDWDNVAGQLRLSKLTGTPSAPLITVGTQFPQSPNSWQFNAARITTAGTQSGGYLPQRQLAANLTSGTRIMANDSRIQNCVLRNGKLWTTHTVMLASTPTAAGTGFGAANPDNHSGVQWWQIDPTIETGLSTAPLQRGRIEDPTADNCHDGAAATKTAAPCSNSVLNQHGEFFAFPNIAVNQSDDVLIGFSRFSGLTYPNSSYAIRRSSDPVNTMRDPIIYRPGQANYNIGGGSGATRQNRWGDYSSSQTDPLNDTDFWAVQEYAGTQRNDFLAPSYAGPWETWWALVKPTTAAPTSGTAIISEFRLRGPQGVRDEYVKVYNPGATPIIVETTDGSDGWALGFSPNGTTITGVAVIPNGTVIPAHGSFLITDNPDNTAGGTSALTYSLNATPSIAVRNADSDTGWAFDLADNGGVALFNTANTANFAAGTRLDSAGFAPIAAGLFKEGAGIPAITAATPTGQMTFHRILTTGVPQDTGANENDFQFVDPALENLTVQSKLGAAGPQNLDSPLNSPGATFPSVVLDGAVSATTAPNTLRVPTPAVTNGAFGTITFRRTFTNNTGADLKRLRFRVVDITTAIAAGPNADLRPTSISAGSVFLSGGGTVNVTGSTLETPPTQTLGGGYNSTISAASIALATPLLAGASLNLQFSATVNVEGNYNFCLIPEGDTVTASAPLCFSGSTLDTLPSITPGAPVARTTGESGSATIATVSDVDQAAGTLVVTPISVPAGISITGIVNTAGTVTATVAASCSATVGANNVTLQVADSSGGTNTATFVVNVTNPVASAPSASNTGPYCAGGTISLSTPFVAGASYSWTGPTGFTSSLQNPTRTNVAVADGGIYSVTITITGCTSPAGTTNVTVNAAPSTPTITPTPTSVCPTSTGNSAAGPAGATSYAWSISNGTITSATNIQTITYTAGASGTVGLTLVVTNASNCSATNTVNVTINANPATPTITPTPASVCPSSAGNTAAGPAGATSYAWSITNGTITSATNIQTITYTAGASGTVGLTLVVTNASGCSATNTSNVTINPNPATPTITPTPAQVCASSTGNSAAGPAGATSYAWSISNGTITSATNIQTVTYTAGASGTVGLTLVVTNASGCSATNTSNVTINAKPNATITAAASAQTGSTGNVASVANAGVGATYAWSVTGGTLTGGNNTPSITYTAGAVGTLTINVTVTNAAGCSDAKSANVTVTPPPVTVTSVSPVGGTIAGGSAVTINGTGFNAGATVTFGGSAATNVVVVSAIKITARTPAHAAGSVNVTVTNTDTSNGTLTNGYLYKPQQFDPNNDGTISAMDIFYLVNYLYMGGPAPAGAAGVLSGDANGDGVVNPLDIFYLVNYLFLGGPRPNSIPIGPVTAMAVGTDAAHLDGSIALGKAVLRNGHYVVPVIMTAGQGSIAPQAMSLRVHIDGEVGDATIRRAGAAKDLAVAFETDRFAGNDLSYLVSYGNLFLGTTASAVVAEIEVESSNATLSIDPQLTMLSNQAGTMTASVANGKLKVSGTKIGNGSTPQPRTPEHKVN
jgi:hypothetical protein